MVCLFYYWMYIILKSAIGWYNNLQLSGGFQCMFKSSWLVTMGNLYFCLSVEQLICLEWLCQSEIEGGRERGCPLQDSNQNSFACMVYLMQSCTARLHSYGGRTTVWELDYSPPVSSCYDSLARLISYSAAFISPSRMNLSSVPLLSTPTHTHTQLDSHPATPQTAWRPCTAPTCLQLWTEKWEDRTPFRLGLPW